MKLDTVHVDRKTVEEMMLKIHRDDVDLVEIGLTEDYIPELAEIFLRRLQNPLDLERYIGNFMFGDTDVTEVQAIQKEWGTYKREDWLMEFDKFCPGCGKIYMHEDPETDKLEVCTVCGKRLEVNNGL